MMACPVAGGSSEFLDAATGYKDPGLPDSLLVLTTLTQISVVSMGPGLVGEPRCGSQCRTFVRRLHTPVLAKPRRMLRSPYVVVLTYLLSEQSLTSLNGAPGFEPCRNWAWSKAGP